MSERANQQQHVRAGCTRRRIHKQDVLEPALRHVRAVAEAGPSPNVMI